NPTLTQLHTKQCHGDAVNSDTASQALNRHRTVTKTVINPSGRLTPQLRDRKSGELETKEPDDLETAVSEVNIGDARGAGRWSSFGNSERIYPSHLMNVLWWRNRKVVTISRAQWTKKDG